MKIQSKKFQNNLNRMIRQLNKLPRDLSKELVKESNNTFINNNWAPKVDGSKATLIDTGDMKKGIKSSYTNNSSTLYNNVKYGQYHQYGTDKLPVRKFMIDDNNKIIDIVIVLINKIIK